MREHLEVIDKSVIWLWGLRGNGQEWLNLFGTEEFCIHGNLIQCFPARENQHVFYSSKTIFTEITAVFRIGDKFPVFRMEKRNSPDAFPLDGSKTAVLCSVI